MNCTHPHKKTKRGHSRPINLQPLLYTPDRSEEWNDYCWCCDVKSNILDPENGKVLWMCIHCNLVVCSPCAANEQGHVDEPEDYLCPECACDRDCRMLQSRKLQCANLREWYGRDDAVWTADFPLISAEPAMSRYFISEDEAKQLRQMHQGTLNGQEELTRLIAVLRRF